MRRRGCIKKYFDTAPLRWVVISKLSGAFVIMAHRLFFCQSHSVHVPVTYLFCINKLTQYNYGCI